MFTCVDLHISHTSQAPDSHHIFFSFFFKSHFGCKKKKKILLHIIKHLFNDWMDWAVISNNVSQGEAHLNGIRQNGRPIPLRTEFSLHVNADNVLSLPISCLTNTEERRVAARAYFEHSLSKPHADSCCIQCKPYIQPCLLSCPLLYICV